MRDREIFPVNRSLFAPCLPRTLTLPREKVCRQRLPRLFLREQLPWRRLCPIACCENASVTVPGSLRLKKNVVPTGTDLLARELCSRQRRWDIRALLTSG